MITVTAFGHVAKQPELKVISPTAKKCEFDVLDKRSVKEAGEWVEVVESATFVAWGDDAEYLAERLVPGRELEVVGIQETSRWMDGDVQRKRITYRVVHFHFRRRGNVDGQQVRRDAPARGDSKKASPVATTNPRAPSGFAPARSVPAPVAPTPEVDPRVVQDGNDPGPSEDWFKY